MSANPDGTALPPVRVEADARARIRASLRAAGRRLAVLDDDPTGSQTVHDVAVVTVLDPDAIAAGLDRPSSTCFVLTNTRSMGEADAVALNTRVGRTLFELDAALAMADVDGANVANAAALLTLGRMGLHTGDDGLVATAHRLGAERVDKRLPSMRQSLTWLRALEAAARGDPARALACVTSGDDQDEPGNGLPGLPRDITDDNQLVRIALAAGDRARALDTVERAERRAADHPATATMAGVAAHARGLLDGDLDTLAAAVERHRCGVRPLALASALEDTGSHAASGGHRSAAVQWLGEALETYVRLGATWDVARTRGKLRDLGVRRRIGSPQRRRAGWDGLTESELRVVRLAARGLTNRQIGEQLFLSPHTVSSHLRHTFTKLEISSRVELARMATQHDPIRA